MRLIRASELPEHALVDLFNAGYSDYLLPMRLTTAAFAEHVAANDIDLECSRVVRDDQPAALALIGHRDGAGWVGGMATVPGYRRRGLGAEALTAGLAALADRGASVAWLEVIDHNRRALALYEKLGFEVVRDLVVWSLPARATDSTPSRTIDASSAHAWIRANRQDREPWQRADESVAAIGARGGALRGVAVDRDGQAAGTALLREAMRRPWRRYRWSRSTSRRPQNCCLRPPAPAASCGSGMSRTMRRPRLRSNVSARDESPRSTRCA